MYSVNEKQSNNRDLLDFIALKQSRTMMQRTRVGSVDEYLYIAVKV
jgi:hypothetical protein